MNIFVPGIGQHFNIGDIILRRPLLRWLGEAAGGSALHVFVGKAPAGYVPALELPDGTHVYHSFSAWYLAAVGSALAGRAIYVFKPGEIQLSVSGLKEHVSMLPLLGLIKAAGRPVIRVGSGSRNFAPVPRALMRPSLAMSDLILWRDPTTAAYMGCGDVMPDLAFADGDATANWLPPEHRKLLVVSMRGDRPPPPASWVRAVAQFAEREQLQICVITQVKVDSERSRELAASLQGELIDWDGTDHLRQELVLRDIYRRSAAAISDRLHVLITAYTHGSVPMGLLCDRSDKIARHFQAAGARDCTLHVGTTSDDELVAGLQRMMAMRQELTLTLDSVRKQLAEVKGRVRALLNPWFAGAPR